jgi:hypothetical protein
MARSRSSSQSIGALQDFFRWESQSFVPIISSLTTDDKTHFMPISTLNTYFSASNSAKLSKILAEVFKSDFPPVDPDLILREHTAVFAILLRVGRGELIEHFARYEELGDRRLPFDGSNLPSEFVQIGEDEGRGDELSHAFCEAQWMYCVPILDGHMLHKHFGKQRLLPITDKEAVGVDGMADKFVVKVFGGYNKLVTGAQDPVSLYLQLSQP